MGASHFPWIESGEVPLVEILHQPFGCRQMLRRKQSWRRLPQLEASSLCHLTNKFGRNPWVRLVFFGQFDFTHSRIIWTRRFQGFNCCWPRLIERKQREIGQGANAKNKLHQKTVGSIFSGGGEGKFARATRRTTHHLATHSNTPRRDAGISAISKGY